jgi:hypothetical protein
VGELLDAVGGVGVYVVLFGLLAWALYYAFGPQVLGLPTMLGVLVLIAGVRIFSNVGLAGLAAVVVGIIALVLIIGMAMTLGGQPPARSVEQKADDDFRR